MANMGVATKEQLTFIDQTVYSPKTVPLVARSIFPSISIDPASVAYTYRVRTGKGVAQAYTNRATDIPVVDEGIKEYSTPIVESALACEYSWLELQRAQAANVNLLQDQAQLVARGLGEREDRIIFNGLDTGVASTSIIGLTNTDTATTGFQQVTADTTFVAANADADAGAMKTYNFLRDAISKINQLAGYASVKPILLLPQAEIDALDTPFNKYNPQTTVLSMIQSHISGIQPVPELEGQYWHAKNATAANKKKDMGLLCVNTSDVCGIPDAMPLTRLQQEYHDGVTKIPYVERHGGLAVRYPSVFVQLLGIN